MFFGDEKKYPVRNPDDRRRTSSLTRCFAKEGMRRRRSRVAAKGVGWRREDQVGTALNKASRVPPLPSLGFRLHRGETAVRLK